MSKITLEQYLRLRRTTFDNILFLSWLPSVGLFFMIGLSLLLNDNSVSSATVGYTILFGMWVPVVVLCRTIYNYRTKKFTEDYDLA